MLGLALLTWLACGACFSSDRGAEETARVFLDQYLIAADQQSAITLTIGRARAQIQQEIDLLSGFQDREEALMEQKTAAQFDKVFERDRPNGDVAFLFRVTLERGGTEVPAQEVFVLLGIYDGRYLVKSFRFRDPTDIRTPDTP